jgi:hypothetical protein
MLQHNSYFDGQVQSVGFERLGRRQSVGVIAPGEHHFGTEAAERMTVVSGALDVRLDGTDTFVLFPAGTYFEIPANSGFDVRVTAPTAYLCEYF